MRKFKGTPGVWEVVDGDDNAPDVVSDIGVEIAFTPTYNGDKTEQWHNAKLIAESPELLSALQQLLEIYDDQYGKAGQHQASAALLIMRMRRLIRR